MPPSSISSGLSCRTWHLIEAKFLGGEPFLIQRYWEIWERFLEVNPKVTIPVTTNGTMLTDRVLSILKALDFRIVLSIDSMVRETYESIRLNADYEEVMRHLRYFLDYMHAKGEPLFAAVCPMRQNWSEMPGMLEFANEQGARLIFNSVLYPESCSLRSLPIGAAPDGNHLAETESRRLGGSDPSARTVAPDRGREGERRPAAGLRRRGDRAVSVGVVSESPPAGASDPRPDGSGRPGSAGEPDRGAR
jgi:hypothetical protein